MAKTRSPLQDLLVQDRVVPASAFAYVQCDVPLGMRLDEWRRERNRARRAAELEAHRARRQALVAHLRRCIGRR
jgi:hypothetical protein